MIIPFSHQGPAADYHTFASPALGDRCFLLEGPDPLRPEFWASSAREHNLGSMVLGEIGDAFVHQQLTWNKEELYTALHSRACCWQFQKMLEQRGYSFDPATITAKAWGASFDGCVTKYTLNLRRMLGLSTVNDNDFDLTVPDASFLLDARLVDWFILRDRLRLFLFECENRFVGLYTFTDHSLSDPPANVILTVEPEIITVKSKQGIRLWPPPEEYLLQNVEPGYEAKIKINQEVHRMYLFQERYQYFQELFDQKDLAVMVRNTNHFPNIKEIKEAMISSIMNEEYHNYAPPYGIRELQELILKDLRAPECYAFITNGATEALYQIARTLLREGDDFISTDPSYFITHNFAKAPGTNVIEIPFYDKKNQYRFTPELLRPHLTPKTKMIYLVDPNNPIGSCLKEEEIIEICNIAKKAGAIFVQDCTYKDFADAHFPAVRYYPEGAILIYSVSKSCGLAGIRIGAIVSHPSVIDQLTKAQMNNLGSNLVSQRGAIAALKTKENWFKSVFDLERKHQSILREMFHTLDGFFPVVYPSQTNFLTVEPPLQPIPALESP